MIQIGYKLSAEEFAPNVLVDNAARAERAGFEFALVSDHYHPWIDAQGQSPFVWSVLGGIARATTSLRVATAVTCPTIRIHPAIVAQAAATTAAMMPGRFFLGLGTGENLNEHVLGEGWPSGDVRLEMLEEALEVIRLLWSGKLVSHRGIYFQVEDARLYTLPDTPPDVMIAAAKPGAAKLAGRSADAIITTEPTSELLEKFDAAGGRGKPRYYEATVCWAASEKDAVRRVRDCWPLPGIAGPLLAELPLPSHFEAAAASVTVEMVAEKVPCGPDPEKHVAEIQKAVDAGFTHVCVHQVGADQEGFFAFYEREVLPRFRSSSSRRAG